MSRRILGIDPGSYHLGLGLIEKNGNVLRFLFGETVDAPRDLSLLPRLKSISDRLKVRLDELKPNEIALEDSFFGKNAQSAFRMGITRGVVMAACLDLDLPIFEYPPASVKSVVTGSGRADKAQVKKMVSLSFGRSLEDLGFDATDAIAVALCHAHSIRLGGVRSC